MPVLPLTSPKTSDAVRLLSAVSDVFGGHPIGFGIHVAYVAARFTAYRGREPQLIAAAFCAAALHSIGAVSVTVGGELGEREAQIARWAIPWAGATIVAALDSLPPGTADAIRWHREAFDGTGFPDRLRWNGIPEAAMAVNVARAFVTALEAQAEQGGSAADAVFTLVNASGSVFCLATMHDFREFLAAAPDTFDAPYEPEWPALDADIHGMIRHVCAAIDARRPRTTGRGDRLERIIRAIVTQPDIGQLDPDRAAFSARLTSLSRLDDDDANDAAQAALAARMLAVTPAFAPYAAAVGATAEWYNGAGLPAGQTGVEIDPIARLIAVALVAESADAGAAPPRVEAAAGSQLDPTFVTAYLAAHNVVR